MMTWGTSQSSLSQHRRHATQSCKDCLPYASMHHLVVLGCYVQCTSSLRCMLSGMIHYTVATFAADTEAHSALTTFRQHHQICCLCCCSCSGSSSTSVIALLSCRWVSACWSSCPHQMASCCCCCQRMLTTQMIWCMKLYSQSCG